jgi:pimeloyl-ACP methyl ester carboxylesterase
MDDYAFIDRLWADWSPGYDASFDLARVKASIGTPERITAAIGYYRALYDAGLHDPALAEVQAAGLAIAPRPTLYLHGADDGCFSLEAVGDPLAHLAEGSEVAIIEQAGHFLHLEAPQAFNARVRAFLAG